MDTAVIIHKGRAVKTNDFIEDSIRWNFRGFMSRFTTTGGIEYIFVKRSSFRTDINSQYAAESGYYNKNEYLDYYRLPTSTNISNLKISKYDGKFVYAEDGDQVKIELPSAIEPPYNEFYKKVIYTFTHRVPSPNHITFYNATGENGKLAFSFIRSQENFQQVTEISPNPPINALAFFNNNLSVINSIPNIEHDRYEVLVIKTALRVGMIEHTIFPILRQGCSGTDLIDLNNLIGDIQNQWNSIPNTDFVSLKQLSDYRHYLGWFYASIYRNQKEITNPSRPCRDRHHLLFNLLSQDILTNTITYTTKRRVLEDFMKYEKLNTQNGHLVLKIMRSFSENEYNQFLDFLLEMPDAKQTNFESLYNLMEDTQLSEITIIGWFATKRTNRKHFIYALYEIWKKSKYNFLHIPDGGTANADGLNEESFFLTEENIDKYWYKDDENGDPELKELHLEFSLTQSALGFTVTKEVYKPNRVISGQSIELIWKKDSTYSFDAGVTFISNTSTEQKSLGNYHLYQPISLAGYEEAIGINVPDEPVPVFLFYYAEEFQRMKEINGAINFGIDIGIEIVAILLTGGVSSVRHLRHLRYITKLRRASELPAATRLLAWRGLEVGAELVAISAGTMAAYTNYVSTTATDPDRKDLADKLSFFFLFLTLASAGTAYASRVRSADAGIIVLDEIADMTVSHNLSAEVLDVIVLVTNSRVTGLNSFNTLVANLDSAVLGGLPNNIITRINTFTDLELIDFWIDFRRISASDSTFWQTLNQLEGIGVDRWKTLRNLEVPDRKLIEVIDNGPIFDAYVRYFNEIGLKNSLLTLTQEERFLFLYDFGDTTEDVFQVVKNNPIPGVRLLTQAQQPITVGPHIWSIQNTIDFLRLESNPTILGYRPFVNNRAIFDDAIPDGFSNTDFSIAELTSLFNRNLTHPNVKTRFRNSNRIYTTVEAFVDNTPVTGYPKIANFVSGNERNVRRVFVEDPLNPGELLTPDGFVNPSFENMKNFGIKAIDEDAYKRLSDSELKFIYHFLSEHWDDGNRFVIEIESVLFTCSSCNRYLKALIDYGTANGKTIELNFKSNFGATSMSDTKKLIN